ncbi:uncharacterized protein LOC120889554 [Ictidomys tridecemlineatus]
MCVGLEFELDRSHEYESFRQENSQTSELKLDIMFMGKSSSPIPNCHSASIRIKAEVTNKFMPSCCLKASQIIIGFIHSALGILWISLFFLEEQEHSTGPVSMLMLTIYSFASGVFLTVAMVMNIVSLFVAIIGLIIECIQVAIFEPKGIQYIWSHMAGMMLLQFLFLTTAAELVLSIISLNVIRKAFEREIIE